MSELTLVLIRFAYLAILWIFVLSAISVIRSDMFGARVAREGGRGNERKAAKAAETELAKLNEQLSAIDRAMFDPSSADAALAKLTMTELMKRRAEIEARIETAETAWMEASEALEALAA